MKAIYKVELIRELRLAVVMALAWAALYIATRPPVTVYDMSFIETAAYAGDVVHLRVTGEWRKRCPTAIARLWRDADGHLIRRLPLVPAGAADPEPGVVKFMTYPHQVPETYIGGRPVEGLVSLVLVMEHRCGVLPSSTAPDPVYVTILPRKDQTRAPAS